MTREELEAMTDRDLLGVAWSGGVVDGIGIVDGIAWYLIDDENCDLDDETKDDLIDKILRASVNDGG